MSYFNWTRESEARLKELAKQGYQGQDIACMLSDEFPGVVTVSSAFHKAQRLGIGLRGRSPPLDAPVRESDPFSRPKWLSRSIEDSERERHPAPGAILIYYDDEPAPDTEPSYCELWRQYVDSVVQRGKASAMKGETAKLLRVPEWFREWANVVAVQWDPGMRRDPI